LALHWRVDSRPQTAGKGSSVRSDTKAAHHTKEAQAMLTARRETKHRLDTLREIPFLANCTARELARIDRLGARVDVAPGRTLTREGAIGRECFVTLDGVATVARAGVRIGTIGAGSIAGELALLDHTSRNATVVAGTRMHLLVLSPPEFEELLEIAPGIEATIVGIAHERRAALH
jgi:CRP-like cAMP-binding protein